MKRAIDASRSFTEILAAQQLQVLGRLDEIATACTEEIAKIEKETKALVHIVEDHGKASVMRLTVIRAQVLRLAQEIAEGTAGPDQVVDDLNRQKGLDAVRSAVMPAKLDEPGSHTITIPLAQLTPTGDAIQGEAA